MTPDRQCGDCQLCCKLLPVRSLGKGAGERCRHQQHHKGCKVYAQLLNVAPECRLWNCRWLVNDDAGDLSRPDRSHYVIDIMPDFIKADDGDGNIVEVPVVQVWVDPSYPDAHRDLALRAWLDRREAVALIRYSSGDGFVLFPPSRMANGQWMEKGSINDGEPTHSAAEVFRVCGEEIIG
jgi:hypothetical protein